MRYLGRKTKRLTKGIYYSILLSLWDGMPLLNLNNVNSVLREKLTHFGSARFERLPLAVGRSCLGSLGEAAAYVAHRFQTSIPAYRHGPDGATIGQQAGKALKKWARAQDAFISEKELKKAIAKSRLIELPVGTESQVFLGAEGKYVYKISNAGKNFYRGDLANHWRNFFYRMIAHNALFPSVPYEIIGFTDKEDDLGVVVRQPAIEFRAGLNSDEVHTDLNRRGFFQDPTKKWSNSGVHERYGFKVEDLHPGNVVWDMHTGNPVYIDPLITFHEHSIFKQHLMNWIDVHCNPEI